MIPSPMIGSAMGQRAVDDRLQVGVLDRFVHILSPSYRLQNFRSMDCKTSVIVVFVACSRV